MLDTPNKFISGNLYQIKKLEYKKDMINYHILYNVVIYGNLNILEYIIYTLYYKINKDDLYKLIEISIKNKRYHILKCLTDIIVKNVQQKKCTIEYTKNYIKYNKYYLFDLIEISFSNEQYHILKYLVDVMVTYVDKGNRI